LTNGSDTSIDWEYFYSPPDITTNTSIANPPVLAQEHCDINTMPSGGPYVRRTADTEIKLATGGPLGSVQQNLWAITVSATDVATGLPIPNNQICIEGFGNPDTNGNLILLLPDNEVADVTAGVPGHNEFTFSLAAQEYKLIIYLDRDITDQTTNAYVGEQKILQCWLEPALGAPFITNYLWNVGGNAVGGYTAVPTLGANAPLALTNPAVAYYWVDKADAAKVSCKVNAAGKEWSAKTTFKVLKPTADWIGATNGAIALDSALHYGTTNNLASVGIIFTFTNKNLMGYTNSYSFLSAQIGTMQIVADGTNAAGAAYTVQLDGSGLDFVRTWFYKSFGTSDSGQTDDSPATPPGPTPQIQPLVSVQSLKNTYSLSHYLFFQPAGDSIPVAIKRVDWNLSMQATNSGASTSVDGLVPAGCSAAILANNVPVTGNPGWTNYLQNVSTNITAH
jgi:hypothetical protein